MTANGARDDCLRCCGTGLHAPEVVCDRCFVSLADYQSLQRVNVDLMQSDDKQRAEVERLRTALFLASHRLYSAAGYVAPTTCETWAAEARMAADARSDPELKTRTVPVIAPPWYLEMAKREDEGNE